MVVLAGPEYHIRGTVCVQRGKNSNTNTNNIGSPMPTMMVGMGRWLNAKSLLSIRHALLFYSRVQNILFLLYTKFKTVEGSMVIGLMCGW